MSQNRKMLKLLSFAQVIVSVIAVVMAFLAAGGPDVQGLVTKIPALAATALHALAALLTFACAFFGIRGANRPSGIGPHRALAAAEAVAGAAGVALLGMSAGGPILPLAVAALGVAAFVLNVAVVKEADR
ncbi:MAG: hypothetical protein SOU51_05865 [Collinsella sp.]|nr:hypothetical protein [Collinsella sp.]